MLLSLHIPKTAGVSLRNVLKEYYGVGFVLWYWKITDAYGHEVEDIPANATCVHGHFAAHQLADRFPEADLVTWVRDPVERVVSSYFHRLRDPDWQHPVCRKLHEERLSLLECAALPEMRNEMSHFMNGREPADFSFIGFTETFDASLDQFCAQFGLPSLPVRRDNSNPSKQGDYYDIPADVRAKIYELNAADAGLYEECKRLFWEKSAPAERALAGGDRKSSGLSI